MADNSNPSSLFGDMTDATPASVTPSGSANNSQPAKAEPAQTSDSLATILGGASNDTSVSSSVPVSPDALPANSPVIEMPSSPVASPEPVLPNSADSMASILGSLATTSPPTLTSLASPVSTESTPKEEPKMPSMAPVMEKVTESVTTPQMPEIITPPSEPEPVISIKPLEQNPTDDPRLKHYLEEDVIYTSMLRIIDADRIRLRLAIRYMILMFAIFLVIVWIVNNRIIMLGFSEFQWLARIRDSLFGVIAGLFSLTIWFGSEVWFHRWFLTWFFRGLAFLFFVAVLSALYFPLW